MTRAERRSGAPSRIRRLLLDAGLPPETSRAVVGGSLLRVRRACSRAFARALPTRSARRWPERRRLGSRRWPVDGQLPASFHELALHFAGAVADALRDADVETYIVGRDQSSLVIGIDLDDRDRAWRALGNLAASDTGTHWYVQWRYGRWSGIRRLGAGRGSLVRRATSWRIFQLYAWGDELAVGDAAAVEVSFWAERPDGLCERIGVRGPDRFPVDSPPTIEMVDGRAFPGRADLPVSSAWSEPPGPIDVVVTWVDPSDPAWRSEFAHWNQEIDDVTGPDGRGEARYRDLGELRAALRAVWAYAGWVRRIYLVTAGHVPPWLEPHERLRVVSHSEIFPEELLPTFSSHAIESRLHHIPGLSERFVYLNDDVFLARPLRPSAFFSPAGLPRVPLSRARIAHHLGPGAATVDLAARNAAILIHEDTGRWVTHKPSHGPFALRRDHLAELEERFPDAFARTAASRFRSPTDVSVASVLAPLHSLATGRAEPADLVVDYVNVEHERLALHLWRLEPDGRADAFCLNSTAVPARDPDRAEAMVRSFLTHRFPVPAPWERR